jgi:hypothetical protein
VANTLPQLYCIAQEALTGATTNSAEIAGKRLQIALEDLSQVLAQRVLHIHEKDVPRIFAAYQKREA